MATMSASACGLCGTVASLSYNSSIGGSKLHRSARPVNDKGFVGEVRAAANGGKGGDKKDEKKTETKPSLFTSITDALDFAQTRSEKDAELLEDARSATKSGEKMSREQYGALRRKIGGTYKDFFKDSVEVVGDYVDDGWVDKRCKICKKDTSKEPRTVDNMGRYAHVACAEKAKSGNIFMRLFNR